jgi:hypothetical protein
MTFPNITRHGATRLSQRGIDGDDLALIEEIGTEVEGGYMVLNKNFQVYERKLLQLRERARRLVGKRVVIADNRLVTAYHAGRRKQRQLIRQAEERCLAD